MLPENASAGNAVLLRIPGTGQSNSRKKQKDGSSFSCRALYKWALSTVGKSSLKNTVLLLVLQNG